MPGFKLLYRLLVLFNVSSVLLDKYQSQFGTGNQMFSYYHEEDESSFQLVDTSRPQRPLYQRNRNRFGQVSQSSVQLVWTSDPCGNTKRVEWYWGTKSIIYFYFRILVKAHLHSCKWAASLNQMFCCHFGCSLSRTSTKCFHDYFA